MVCGTIVHVQYNGARQRWFGGTHHAVYMCGCRTQDAGHDVWSAAHPHSSRDGTLNQSLTLAVELSRGEYHKVRSEIGREVGW